MPLDMADYIPVQQQEHSFPPKNLLFYDDNNKNLMPFIRNNIFCVSDTQYN